MLDIRRQLDTPAQLSDGPGDYSSGGCQHPQLNSDHHHGTPPVSAGYSRAALVPEVPLLIGDTVLVT